jgi:hypothetical protein
MVINVRAWVRGLETFGDVVVEVIGSERGVSKVVEVTTRLKLFLNGRELSNRDNLLFKEKFP